MSKPLLDRLFRKRVIINCDKDPYLIRWYMFRTKPFAIFLHKFVKSDEDRALHDHPWCFIVIPIWMGYIEYSKAGKTRVWPIWSTAYRDCCYQHRVELINDNPSWSIFIRFRRQREWGFWPKEGFVNWKKWWSDLCED